jgi:hypothetical protein
MVQSVDSDAVLALGKKLVAELELNEPVDTLSCWMAHYIAELIQAAETADSPQRPDMKSRCCATILELWQHRSELPNGKRPFKDIEPILRSLQSLDPEDDTPRYFRAVRSDEAKTDQEAEAKQWLELADGIDDWAKVLIRHCLVQAAEHVLNRSQEWVKHAASAAAEARVEALAVRFLSDENAAANAEGENKEFRKRLESRISGVDSFVEMSKKLADHWRAQLAALSSKPSVSEVAEADTIER